uniref:(northern house mosquito) hypothetical protein n=1 Tax=Culex pipiens TaxID=7175 RepID=A0A8D8P8R0_CULPI
MTRWPEWSREERIGRMVAEITVMTGAPASSPPRTNPLSRPRTAHALRVRPVRRRTIRRPSAAPHPGGAENPRPNAVRSMLTRPRTPIRRHFHRSSCSPVSSLQRPRRTSPLTSPSTASSRRPPTVSWPIPTRTIRPGCHDSGRTSQPRRSSVRAPAPR